MYTPKIKDELIHQLWLLKQKRKRPITKLANEAIKQYLDTHKNEIEEAERELNIYRRPA